MKKVLFIIALTVPHFASANAEIRCHWNVHYMSSESAAMKQLQNIGYDVGSSAAQNHKVLFKLFIGNNFGLSREISDVDKISRQDDQFLGCSSETFSVIP